MIDVGRVGSLISCPTDGGPGHQVGAGGGSDKEGTPQTLQRGRPRPPFVGQSIWGLRGIGEPVQWTRAVPGQGRCRSGAELQGSQGRKGPSSRGWEGLLPFVHRASSALIL